MTEDLAAFYAAAYPRLVALLTVTTGARAEAEEIAQDAVVALITAWPKVSRYDDPEARLRRVAMRKAVSRWRAGRVAASVLVRLRPVGHVEPDVAAALDVAVALTRLNLAHRQVVLLHYALGLSVEAIAHELGVRPGTIKSRLSRARAVLAPLLKEEVR